MALDPYACGAEIIARYRKSVHGQRLASQGGETRKHRRGLEHDFQLPQHRALLKRPPMWGFQGRHRRQSTSCQRVMDGVCQRKSPRSHRECARITSEVVGADDGCSNFCPSMLTKVGNLFDRKILAGNSSYKHSILREALPAIVAHPPYLHAYIAFITLTDMNAAPYWRERAMLHYSHALNGLINAIANHTGPGARWKRATAMLLHLYEVCNDLHREHLLLT